MGSGIPELFLAQHRHIHTATVAGAPSRVDRILNGLGEAQLRTRPPGHNSIVWILWHLARVEDLMVNAVLRGAPEVFDRGGWQARIGVKQRDVGTGMTAEEVAEFSTQVGLSALLAYRAAVGEETRSGLTSSDFENLDEPVTGAAERALASGDLTAGAKYVAEVLTTRGRWFPLCVEIIGHGYEHLGEADHIARLLGRSGA